MSTSLFEDALEIVGPCLIQYCTAVGSSKIRCVCRTANETVSKVSKSCRLKLSEEIDSSSSVGMVRWLLAFAGCPSPSKFLFMSAKLCMHGVVLEVSRTDENFQLVSENRDMDLVTRLKLVLNSADVIRGAVEGGCVSLLDHLEDLITNERAGKEMFIAALASAAACAGQTDVLRWLQSRTGGWRVPVNSLYPPKDVSSRPRCLISDVHPHRLRLDDGDGRLMTFEEERLIVQVLEGDYGGLEGSAFPGEAGHVSVRTDEETVRFGMCLIAAAVRGRRPEEFGRVVQWFSRCARRQNEAADVTHSQQTSPRVWEDSETPDSGPDETGEGGSESVAENDAAEGGRDAQAPPPLQRKLLEAIESESRVMRDAAFLGRLDVLRLLRSHEPPFAWDESVCAAAARGGHLRTLKCLRLGTFSDSPEFDTAPASVSDAASASVCPWYPPEIRLIAARRGDVGVLNFVWAETGRSPGSVGVCAAARRARRWDALRWLREVQQPPCPSVPEGCVQVPPQMAAFEVSVSRHLGERRLGDPPDPPDELREVVGEHVRAVVGETGAESLFSCRRALRRGVWGLVPWLARGGGEEVTEWLLQKGVSLERTKEDARAGLLSVVARFRRDPLETWRALGGFHEFLREAAYVLHGLERFCVWMEEWSPGLASKVLKGEALELLRELELAGLGMHLPALATLLSANATALGKAIDFCLKTKQVNLQELLRRCENGGRRGIGALLRSLADMRREDLRVDLTKIFLGLNASLYDEPMEGDTGCSTFLKTSFKIQGGISSATAAVVPSKGTWGGLKGSGRGASEHSKTPGGRQSESRTVALRRLTSERPKAISRSDRSGSRLEEPPPTTVTASKDPAEPAEEDPTVKPITDEAEAPRQEGEWRQRMWENREEWEKWKGGSFEREVREYWRGLFLICNKGVGGGGGAGTKVKKVEESAGRFSDFSHDPNAHPERGENQVENAPEVLWKKREDEVQEEQAQGREHRRKDLCEGEERIWSLAMNLLEVARLKFSASTEDGGTGGEDGAVQLACGIGSILRCLESVGVMMTPAGSVKGVEVEVVDSRDESSKEGGEMAWFDETRLLQYTKSGGKVTVRLSEGELLSDPSGDSMGISVVTDPLGKQEAESIILSAGLQCGSLRRFQIEIRDTGRGIPEDKMKDIWSEYAQVKAQDAAVGSGLGLSIVKAILTAMGGSAHISSEEGVGTCLNLSFVVRTLVPRGGSLGGQEDEESVGAGTDDSLAMPNHLERSFNHSFMNSMSGKGGESNPFSLKRMRLGPGRREKSLSVDQVSSADGFPTLKSRQAVPQRRTPSGPGLFSGVGGKMKGMKSKSGGENGNGLSDVSVKRCVWEGLKRQAEAGRPDILWAELEGMPVETLSALLVQDIVKKVGFPPDRTLSFEDPQEVPPQILSLVGGPLPQGQTTPAVEGVGSVLMLTDMQMGDMSGLALTRKVKDVVKEVGAVVGPFPDPLACKNDQEMGLTEPLITDHGGKPIPLKDALWRSNSQLDSQKPIPLKDALWRSNSQLDSPPSPKSVQHEGERLKRKDKRERSTASAPPESAHGILRACTNSHASKGDASNFFCGGSQLSDDKSGGPNGKSLHPSQTGSKRASVQWAVRLAPPPDEACVLRLCLLSAQLRSGILERHPEADTVMDEILEKPLYPPSLAEQLRLLAAHVLFNRGRNKAGGATQT
uniref:histidine kinase n=1 Tax=Chromera velia CCMP2878 TaxID=1169474 RepID=A0A0G4F5H9_9ALVE|eukprot:Cvel_15341.t1-p1 / transcript=Cvel_15341.t1 / gene=Cvel_15341 / organism=Chromera_velia_CCMP2878 / gene_product=hypothetical protein / transcript_product=hypothetical protein / location=Cvel_scaffold1129:5581-27922(-) / protein_length=1686 / sequence_SO=supercontig / SO=protein_coding / is_pseudo=false